MTIELVESVGDRYCDDLWAKWPPLVITVISIPGLVVAMTMQKDIHFQKKNNIIEASEKHARAKKKKMQFVNYFQIVIKLI